MGRRSKSGARCAGCRMLLPLCFCDTIPSLDPPSRWVFLQHLGEVYKTTNTAMVAHRALTSSQLSVFKSRTEGPLPALDLGERRESWLLYPRTEVPPVPVADVVARGRPITIVVLDGTWKQTRKMARVVPAIADLPCIGLPVEAHPRWSIRAESLVGGMSTLDAVCWMLRAIEGEAVAAPLEVAARTMFERTMASRGTPVAPPDGSAVP